MGEMRSVSQAASDVGRVRKNNEDSFIALDTPGLYAVADGVGGENAGETASRIFVEKVAAAAPAFAALEERAGGDPDTLKDEFLGLVEQVFQDATRAMYTLAHEDQQYNGMATTGVILAVLDGRVVIGHVGDSRAYLVRKGEMRQLTKDHSLVQEMLDAGTLQPADVPHFQFRSVLTRALGQVPQVRVDTLWLDAHPGDRFILCSDGLYGTFEPDELAEVCKENVNQAIAATNVAGGPDNISAVFVDVTGRPTHAIAVDAVARLRALIRLPLFKELDEQEILTVLKVVGEQQVSQGSPLVREGDPGEQMFMIVEGRLQVMKEKVSLGELGPGALLGEMALIDLRPRSASVIALEPSTVLMIQRDDFDKLTRGEPKIASKILRSLVRSLTERLRALSEDFVHKQ